MKIVKMFSFTSIFIFLTITFAGFVEADSKCIDDCVEKAHKSGYYGNDYANFFNNCWKQCPQKKSSKPDGFCGIKWETSRKAVLEAIKVRGWQFIREFPQQIECAGSFNGQYAYIVFTLLKDSLVAGQANTGAVRLDGDLGWAEITYKNIVEDLGKKYGPPQKVSVKDKYSYSEWTFFDSNTKDDLIISVSFPKYDTLMFPNLYPEKLTGVRVSYRNRSLEKRLNESDL